MIYEKSCGAVIYKKINGVYYFLIERAKRGHYTLVKGHVENDECEVETALREIKEETNLEVKIDTNFKETIGYFVTENRYKNVVFFIAEAISDNIVKQDIEVSELHYLTFDKAYKMLTNKLDKDVLLKAYIYLIRNNLNRMLFIGSPGSGKSYLSKFFNKFCDVPLYHLDRLYWYGSWQHITREELIIKQKEILKEDKWIIDGNYKSTLELRLASANIVIYFDLPTKTCLNGIKYRVKHDFVRDDMPSSCVENEVNLEFEEYVKNFKKTQSKKIKRIIAKYNCNVLTIKNKKQVKLIIEYLNKNGLHN